ncbi:MAG: mechanosensitive ion channel family protein [Holosporales bacterium]|jgi:small-conductance mechanosensitive channel|nr:mechanosensitive ion channel family protein [Holosporales bacterium]
MKDEFVETGTAAKTLLEQANINKAAIIEILLIILLCIAARIFLKRACKRFVLYVQRAQKEQKVNVGTHNLLLTTTAVFDSIGKIIILLIGVVTCLSAVNISISPVVYGLGFISLGVSLGAQDTFTDIIRGILTLIEGKIAPGNCVTINGAMGIVDAISIRQITLRHFDGSLEAFPFSKIGTIRNFSIGYRVMACTFHIAQDSDITAFKAMTKQVLDSMRKDPTWSMFISEETPDAPTLEFEKVTNISVKIIVRARINVDPLNSFASEFNRRMLDQLQSSTMLRLVNAFPAPSALDHLQS